MYSSLPSFVLGFHGCDASVGEAILTGKREMRLSENDYDWLGHRVYFWENNPQRALDYACLLKDHPTRVKEPIGKPFVLGAVIDPGTCLNLLDSKHLVLVKAGYESLVETAKKAGFPLPENKAPKGEAELLLKNLDCAVVEFVHVTHKEKPFDTIRAVYVEGEPLYPNAGFHAINHIQICVRNPACIKGFFLPRLSTEARVRP